MPFAIGGNQLDTGYEVSNSLRFNDDDSASLTRTPSSDGNKKTFTWSGWVKRGNITSTNQHLFAVGTSGSNFTIIRFNGTNLRYSHQASGSTDANLITTQVFRDPSAWYHIVVAVDNTQSTASDRVNIYVNGTLITNFGTEDYPTNIDTHVNATNIHRIGDHVDSATQYFDGYLAEVNLIDGQQLLPTSFGEFNDNGVWIPIKYLGTYGTNGFFMEFKQTGTSQNSSGIGADTSGNDNHFAVSNLSATDVTTDTCTNNFCTLNPLYQQGSNTFSEGNCKVVLEAGDGSKGVAGGIAPANGKWYWEVKQGSATNSSILVREASDKEDDLSYYQGNFAAYVFNNGNQNITGNTNSTYGPSYSSGDIIMVAMDMDNDRVYFGKNGQWIDGSGNADESSINDFVPLNGVTNGLGAFANANGSATATAEFNWGNPSFSISSGNSDANGYGNFEYAVPSGYYAICTKNLAEYG
jgi:hypothetical protein